MSLDLCSFHPQRLAFTRIQSRARVTYRFRIDGFRDYCWSEWIDWLFDGKKSWQFLRLLTSNNMAYVSLEGLLVEPYLKTYSQHSCEFYKLAVCPNYHLISIGKEQSEMKLNQQFHRWPYQTSSVYVLYNYYLAFSMLYICRLTDVCHDQNQEYTTADSPKVR